MDVKGASDYYPVVEEYGKQLKRLSNTTGGPVGSGDAVANANVKGASGYYPVVEEDGKQLKRLSNTTGGPVGSGDAVANANVKGASGYYPAVEEDGKQLKRLSNTTGGPVGSGDAVSHASTNRLRGWQHSSKIIRFSRASGSKDRHSKVWTSKGLRDRRVRLSVTTAIQFYDLQDRLGYDQPSKALEWLIKAAADPIAELPSLKSPFPDTPKPLRDDKHASEQMFDSADVELDGDPNFQQDQSQHLSMSKYCWNSASESRESSCLTLSRSEIRDNSESSRLCLEEKGEKQIASEPHDDFVIDVEAFKMADLSEQKKFEIEEIGNLASQSRQPEGIQAGEMQPGALSTPEVVFDVGAVKILKSSGQMESQNEDIEIEPEASEQCGLFLIQGGLGLTKPPKNEDWKNSKEIYLMDNELSVLPENPRCPNLSALFLPRNYKLRTIPPSFFNYMPALQILNLSRTGIKSLPDSVVRLVSLKRLFLNDCHRLMMLSAKVGDLEQLEVLDLEGAKIMDLPEEIKKLTNLTCLGVSFYGYTSNGRRAMQTNAAVPCGVISALSQLEELNVDVNPDDERWDACVEDIVNEVCTLKRLENLKFYFPKVELLSHFHWNSLKLSHFKFSVGRHVKRIMSRVPRDVEFELERWERCLKYINGVGVPRDIKNVLQHVTAFFLDRHVTVKKLSDFGIGNMKQLKCCVVGECNEVQVIIDAEDAYGEEGIGEIVSESYDAERIVLGSLEYLYIYYMKSLRSIWEGSVQQNSLFLLKSLTLRTCPMLTTIFTQGLLDNLCNLEELKVEDCPSIKSIVSCGNFAELRTSHFLPNLKKILLHYMPGLVSISSGFHIAPHLEFLSLYNCPNLKNPLVDEVSCQDLKKIKGERSWWEALEWSNGRPCYLDEIFVPTDI